MSTLDPTLRPNPAERFLNLFTRVLPGEGSAALLLLANIFLVLAAYYLFKPVREGWLAASVIGSLSKIEVKAYSSFLQALVFLAVLPIYGRLASRWPRRELILRTGGFFLVTLGLFWLLHPGLLTDGIPYIAVAFYVWAGMFALTLVAQFWSFAGDLCGEERGKRLFPLVAVGASAGAVAGSWLGERLIKVHGVETFDLLLVATVPLLLALVLAARAEAHAVSRRAVLTSEDPAAPDPTGAYRLIVKDRYLRLTALMVFAMFWAMTNGENILFAAVQRGLEEAGQAADVKALTTAFYGNLYFWVNLSSLLLQAFLVSRMQHYGGFGTLLLTPPLVSLAGYGAMTAHTTLPVITVAKTIENSVNYSVNNTARQVLWLPTERSAMYKAKAAIDTFCVRFGDGLAALTVLVGVRALGAQVESFMLFNIGLILVWLTLAALVVREHRRLTSRRSTR